MIKLCQPSPKNWVLGIFRLGQNFWVRTWGLLGWGDSDLDLGLKIVNNFFRGFLKGEIIKIKNEGRIKAVFVYMRNILLNEFVSFEFSAKIHIHIIPENSTK